MFLKSGAQRKVIFLAFVALLLVGAYLVTTKNVADTTITNTGANEQATQTEIIRADGADFEGLAVFPTWSVLDPATFPLLIDGEARGTWFFEATFPVEIRTVDGSLLAQGYAQAQNDWMTTDVVPFYIELTKAEGAPVHTGAAALILNKANPSDLPEHDARFTTQIYIDTTR